MVNKCIKTCLNNHLSSQIVRKVITNILNFTKHFFELTLSLYKYVLLLMETDSTTVYFGTQFRSSGLNLHCWRTESDMTTEIWYSSLKSIKFTGTWQRCSAHQQHLRLNTEGCHQNMPLKRGSHNVWIESIFSGSKMDGYSGISYGTVKKLSVLIVVDTWLCKLVYFIHLHAKMNK